MESTLRDFAPSLVALLVGGLGVSIGVTLLVRSARARARLAHTSGRAFGLLTISAIAAAGLVGFWAVRPLLRGPTTDGGMASPLALLFVGIAVGLPISLPVVFLAWSDARAEAKRRSKRRETVPTKDDRRAYANDLLRQIQEASDRPRELSVTVGGDGGRVLILTGDIHPDEIERLTAALRQDLKDLGFRRVEGEGGSKRGWARV